MCVRTHTKSDFLKRLQDSVTNIYSDMYIYKYVYMKAI